MMRYLSDLQKTIDTPSLCAYCKAPAKGFIVDRIYRWYGACSMDHQKKIRESKRLKNVAILSEVGLSHAIKETRETYIETAKQEKTYIMHEWSEKNRRKFFRMMVRHYLNWANKQAETGNMREITEDGSN